MDPLTVLLQITVLSYQMYQAYAKAQGLSDQEIAEKLTEMRAKLKARPLDALKEV